MVKEQGRNRNINIITISDSSLDPVKGSDSTYILGRVSKIPGRINKCEV